MPCRLAWPLALEGTRLQRACSVLCTKPARPTTSSINHPSTRPRSTFHRPHTPHVHVLVHLSSARLLHPPPTPPGHQHCQLPLHFLSLVSISSEQQIRWPTLIFQDTTRRLVSPRSWVVHGDGLDRGLSCDTRPPRPSRPELSQNPPVACRPDHHDPLDAAAPPLSSQLRHRPGMRRALAHALGPRRAPIPPSPSPCPRPHARTPCTLQWTSHQAPQMARPTPQPTPRPSSPRSPANPLPAQQP